MSDHDPLCPRCDQIARVRADERERHGNNCRGMWDEWVHDLRAQVEALRDAARVDRNAAPPGSQSWILNAGRATAYADVLALLGGDS